MIDSVPERLDGPSPVDRPQVFAAEGVDVSEVRMVSGAATGVAFTDGQPIVTALFPDPESSGYVRKDFSVALNLTGTLVDDPDAMLYENYACGGVGNYNGYCNPEIDRMIEQQSMEADNLAEIRTGMDRDAMRPQLARRGSSRCAFPL